MALLWDAIEPHKSVIGIMRVVVIVHQQILADRWIGGGGAGTVLGTVRKRWSIRYL